MRVVRDEWAPETETPETSSMLSGLAEVARRVGHTAGLEGQPHNTTCNFRGRIGDATCGI